MESISIKVNGKINLSLNVMGNNDEYHDLDMVMASVNVYDVITINKRSDKKIIVHFSDGFTGISVAEKTARYMQENYHLGGFDIDIVQNIPVKGGMGGSSADSAGVINALNFLYALNLDLTTMQKIGAKFGSDIAYMVKGGFARCQGRGEKIQYFNCNIPLYLVALFDRNGVDTKQCFLEYDKLPNNDKVDNDELILGLVNNDKEKIINNIYNDLLVSASRINSNITKNLNILSSINANKIFMTGSGATVLALFFDEKQRDNVNIDNMIMLNTVNNGIEIL